MQHEEVDQFEEATYSHDGKQEDERKEGGLMDGSGLAGGAMQEVMGVESLQGFSGLEFSPQQPATIDFSSAYKSESVWPQLDKISSAHAISETPIIFDFVKSNSQQEPPNTTGQFSFLDLIGQTKNEPSNAPFQTQPTPQDFLSLTLDNTEKPKNDLLFEFPTQQQQFFSNPAVQGQNIASRIDENVGVFNWQSVNPQQTSLLQAAEGIKMEEDYSLFNPMSGNVVNSTEETIVMNSQEVKIESVAVQKEEEIFPFDTEEKKQTVPAQIEDPFSFSTTSQPIAIQSTVQVTQAVVEAVQQSNPLDLAFFGQAEIKPQVKQERKESEDFEFGDHVQVNKHQKEPEQARKQSEEFEFQSEAKPETPAIIESSQIEEEQPIQAQEKVEEKPQPQPEVVQTAQQLEQDDEDFGDFQETTATEPKQPLPQTSQPQQVPQLSQQDNQIHLNQNYDYPPNTEPYNTKRQELQSFVDSLPDYSFLFAKAFFT